MKVRGKVKDKKGAILNAALTLITQYGLHGVSMKMIAEEADIAAGTIYVHFKNKEVMLASLFSNITNEINHLVEELYRPDEPFKDNFIRIWSEVLKAYIEDQRAPDFINQYAYSASDNSKDKEQLLTPVYDLLENARKDGIVKQLPLTGLIALIHGPIISLVRMARNTDLLTKDIDVTMYAEACWNAISAD